MNGHMKAHGKHMLMGGVGIAVLAVVLGAGWQQAVTWGLLLACPVGMIGMMWFMGRQVGTGRQSDGAEAQDRSACHEHEAAVPQQRVTAPGGREDRPGV